jgi:hypothetical protein
LLLHCQDLLEYFVVFYPCVIEGLLVQNSLFCFILQIDIHHWHNAFLTVVVLSSGSAAVSASAIAASSFPTSGGGSCSDYLQPAVFQLATSATSAIVSSFMNKSLCACICVSGSQFSAFRALCPPKWQE